MFKVALFTPSIALDRITAAQADAKAKMAHAKTVIDCSAAYARQARDRRTQQQRLNAPHVLKAQRDAYEALMAAKELERTLPAGTR